MYEIVTIVYGIPLSQDVRDAAKSILKTNSDLWCEFGDDEDAYLESIGFELLYHGSAPEKPGYFGEALCEIDGCDDGWHEFSKLAPVIDPSVLQIEKLERRYTELPDALKAWHDPGVFLIWSTS